MKFCYSKGEDKNPRRIQEKNEKVYIQKNDNQTVI